MMVKITTIVFRNLLPGERELSLEEIKEREVPEEAIQREKLKFEKFLCEKRDE